MIDYEKLYKTVAKGLKDYLGCPVIKQNQNKKRPDYPFLSYTIITPMSENKGTYSQYQDGTERKSYTQTWSISSFSDDSEESLILACKAREWLDNVGTLYMNDNDVIVQSVGSVTNRDTFLTTDYEYRNGFDVVFWLYDTVVKDVPTIETVGEM